MTDTVLSLENVQIQGTASRDFQFFMPLPTTFADKIETEDNYVNLEGVLGGRKSLDLLEAIDIKRELKAFLGYVNREIDKLKERISEGYFYAEEISEQTIYFATEFILIFKMLVDSNYMGFEFPFITTEGKGEITFEWVKRSKQFGIFIYPNGNKKYIIARGPHIIDDMDVVRNPSNSDYLSAWEWFTE